jgi:hypothetical protein
VNNTILYNRIVSLPFGCGLWQVIGSCARYADH